jgi:hypothetical protein
MIKAYGRSDDLVELEGDICYEFSPGATGPALLVFDDGTLVSVEYGKPGNRGIWAITVHVRGKEFDRLETCDNEDAEVYSDVLYMKAGVKTCWFAPEALKAKAKRANT